MTDANITPNPDFAGDDADLSAQIGQLFVLLRIADRVQRREHGGHGRHGGFRGEIRSGQGRVLGILALQSPLTQKSLAYMLGVRPQSLSELVSKLEANGLVTRRRDDADRRSFLIELTAAGREAAAEIDSLSMEDPFDVLTAEERQTYADLTAKVISSLEEQFPEIRERAASWHRGGPGFGRGPHEGPHREHHDGPHGRRRRGHHGGPYDEGRPDEVFFREYLALESQRKKLRGYFAKARHGFRGFDPFEDFSWGRGPRAA